MRELLLPWDSQPQEAVQVETNSSLFEGLIECYNFTSTSVNSLTGPGTATLDPLAHGLVSTNSGLAVRTRPNGFGVRGVTFSDTPSLNAGLGITIMLLIHGQAVLNQGTSAAFLTGFLSYNNSTNTVVTPSGHTSTVPLAAGRLNVVVLRWATNGGSGTLHVNGELGVDHNGLGWTAGTRLTSFGGMNGQSGWQADLVGVSTWNRLISFVEVDQLSGNPWQLFAPRTQYIPTSSGVLMPTLGIPTFVPNSLTSSGFRVRVPGTWGPPLQGLDFQLPANSQNLSNGFGTGVN